MRLSWSLLAALATGALLGCSEPSGDASPGEADETSRRDAGAAGDSGTPAPDTPAGGDPDDTPADGPAPSGDGDATPEPQISLGPAVARRLSREEYLNSIESVLGVVLDREGRDLPVDARAPHGFRNAPEYMLLTQDHIEAYFALAGQVADQVDRAALIAAHAPCPEPVTPCFEGFVSSLGTLILRGPLSEAQHDSYMKLFDATLDSPDQWADTSRLVLIAMLQSPSFLYRLERQNDGLLDAELEAMGAPENDEPVLRQVSEFELATRLSFLIWNAAPDQELIDLAAAGQLSDAWDAQVERLLAHPFARRALSQYVEQWLHLDSIPNTFTLGPDMKRETYDLFEHLLWDQDADFMGVFTSQRMEVSGGLARFYGLDAEGDAVQVHDVSAFPYRTGFLSNAGVIIAHTINPPTSMIDRGLFMLHDVLCESVPPPTGESLQQAISEQMVPASSGLSQRERFAMQREDPLCAGCHGTFDPLGEAFEIFDGLGQYATEDEYGNTLSGTGHIKVSDLDAPFENFQEFVEALSKSHAVARCMVEKSLQHAFGRAMVRTDDTFVDEVHAGFEEQGRSYRALLRAIAGHETFRLVEQSQ